VTDRHRNMAKLGVTLDSDEWHGLTERERGCLEAVRKDVEAYKALQFFRRKSGLTEESLIVTFVIYVWSPQVLAEGHSEEVSPAKMARIADRADETAAKISELNDSRYFFEDPQVDDFAYLPRLLKDYAKLVRKKGIIAISSRRSRQLRLKQGNIQHEMGSTAKRNASVASSFRSVSISGQYFEVFVCARSICQARHDWTRRERCSTSTGDIS
jgi:hypothetical protein